jgi:hypothetical protein
MKTQLQKQWSKIACLTFAIFSMATMAYAQSTSDVAKKGSGTVKLVDNKGTIKYLQTSNGLTTIVNTSADVTTTTWQLGGTLTDNTYIDVNGKVFGLDKLTLVTDASTASTNAGTLSSHGTGTGWTVLIRDEFSGAVQKIKLTDLLNVIAGHSKYPIDGSTIYVAGTTAISFDVAYGTTTTLALNVNKVSVYRNGAKLVVTDDYTVDATSGKENFVKVTPVSADWQFYLGDVIEIHWIK